MTITLNGVAQSTGNSIASTTLVINKPTSLANGDVMVQTMDIGSVVDTVTAPAGWLAVPGPTWPVSTAAFRQYAFYKVVLDAAAESSTYTFTITASVKSGGGVQAYSGVDTATPWDVNATSTTASATPLAVAGITTVTSGALLVSGAAVDADTAATLTAPGSMAQEYQTAGKRTAQADEAFPTPGATGTRTWTASLGALTMAGWLGALRPAAAGSPALVLPPWLLQELVTAAALRYSTAGPVPPDALPPQPTVVVPAFAWPASGAAQLFAAPLTPDVVVATSTPTALVVSSPYIPVPVPGADISASQPLGNPAVGTPQPLVVSTAWTAKVPGAILSANPSAPVVSTTATPNALVVSPPYQPVPLLAARISSSQPLGNPAVGTPSPYVVTTTWLPKVPGAQLFANPSAPVVSTTGTPNALVVTPAPGLVLVPGARLFAGSPNTVSAGPLVVSMPFLRLPAPGARIVSNPLVPPAQRTFAPVLVVTTPWLPDRGGAFVSRGTEPGAAVSCQLPRPSSGTTARPGTGTTARPMATTLRPGSGATLRPDTGDTDNPC